MLFWEPVIPDYRTTGLPMVAWLENGCNGWVRLDKFTFPSALSKVLGCEVKLQDTLQSYPQITQMGADLKNTK